MKIVHIRNTSKVLIISLLLGGISTLSIAQAEVDFEKEIWPIFKERCIKCHGASYINKKGKLKTAREDLRLDSPDRIQKGSKENKVLVPGKPKESLIYKLITLPANHDDIMPPKGEPLTKEQIERIAKWIEEGAAYGNWKGLPEKYDHKTLK